MDFKVTRKEKFGADLTVETNFKTRNKQVDNSTWLNKSKNTTQVAKHP
jgi:hypothetical protein